MGTVLITYPAGLVHELSEITVGSAETCMLAGPSIQVDQGLPSSCIKQPVTSFMGIWGLNSTQAETGLWAPESSRKDKPISACVPGTVGANWQRPAVVTD